MLASLDLQELITRAEVAEFSSRKQKLKCIAHTASCVGWLVGVQEGDGRKRYEEER